MSDACMCRQTTMLWVLLLALPGVLGLPAHPFRHAALRRSSPLRTAAAAQQGPPASYLEQPLDQFDAAQRRTWRQRYFVNATFFSGDGPVFLCVGGWPCRVVGEAAERQETAEQAGLCLCVCYRRLLRTRVVRPWRVVHASAGRCGFSSQGLDTANPAASQSVATPRQPGGMDARCTFIS